MKLTIVATKQEGSHQQELKAAAERRGMTTTITDITAEDVSNGTVDTLLPGAVIWRSSSLDLASERTSLLPLLEKKTVASDSLFVLPMTRFKYFQQQMLRQEPTTRQWAIPTYRFKKHANLKQAIKKGELRLPLIVKPDAGSRGEGILQITTLAGVDTIANLSSCVVQSFIPNECDWRVIVIGGASIGVLRRQAAKGSFLNNVSQGATASQENDVKIRNEVGKIATKVASLFHLEFCGVDIIQNQETGEYFVLEVNTAPQWRDEYGFMNITGQQVPDLAIDWVIAKDSLATTDLVSAVEQYYKDRITMIPTESFHFASRLWLWTHDEWARQQLNALKKEYIGTTPQEIESTIQRVVQEGELTSVNSQKAYRKDAFATHPRLQMYNSLLFKVVFCDSVYETGIRLYMKKYVSDQELLDQFNALMSDPDSIRLLSTHAVNFFYLLKNYFKGKLSLSAAAFVSPHELMDLLPGYETLEKSGVVTKRRSIKLQIYLLTHMIIGESRFYARKVSHKAFHLVCQRLEELISTNYFDISLDNKLEFLVCTEISGYTSSLKSLIHQEAERSVSWAGNFVVDTLNSHAKTRAGHCLRISEHRNVLLLMSHKPFIKRAIDDKSSPKANLHPIGRLAHVSFPDFGIRRAVARVDSGATRSSIAADNVFVDNNGVLHFTLMHPGSHLYSGQEFTTTTYHSTKVKNTTTKADRYAVEMRVNAGHKTESILFTLSDRRHMLYPVLLGRNFLNKKYMIDTSRQFVRPLTNPRKDSL